MTIQQANVEEYREAMAARYPVQTYTPHGWRSGWLHKGRFYWHESNTPQLDGFNLLSIEQPRVVEAVEEKQAVVAF